METEVRTSTSVTGGTRWELVVNWILLLVAYLNLTNRPELFIGFYGYFFYGFLNEILV